MQPSDSTRHTDERSSLPGRVPWSAPVIMRLDVAARTGAFGNQAFEPGNCTTNSAVTATAVPCGS